MWNSGTIWKKWWHVDYNLVATLDAQTTTTITPTFMVDHQQQWLKDQQL